MRTISLCSRRTGNAIRNHWISSMKNKVEKYLMGKNINGNSSMFDEKGRYLIADDIDGTLSAVRVKKVARSGSSSSSSSSKSPSSFSSSASNTPTTQQNINPSQPLPLARSTSNKRKLPNNSRSGKKSKAQQQQQQQHSNSEGGDIINVDSSYGAFPPTCISALLAGASQGATYEPVKSTNWVECDECSTWRLLPATVDMEAIGKWKW